MKELQDSSKAAAVSAAAAALLTNSKKSALANGKGDGHLQPASSLNPPIISITPTFNGKAGKKSPPLKKGSPPIKMDSNGALNLASTSPSPTDFAVTSPVSLVASADPSASAAGSRRSPPNFAQRAASTGNIGGVELCVVCGDRASGE